MDQSNVTTMPIQDADQMLRATALTMAQTLNMKPGVFWADESVCSLCVAHTESQTGTL